MLKMDRTYMSTASFDETTLRKFKDGLGWMIIGQQAVCTATTTLKFRGGGGSSEWKDEVTLHVGDALVLRRAGSPASAALAEIIRKS